MEENEQNPIAYEDSPFFSCELTTLNRISFAVADDPFYKSERSKYYPECLLINQKGKLKARINPFNREHERFGMEFLEDIREPQLKLNDDRKIRLVLSKISKPGNMVLFTVRCHDLRRNPPKDGEFDRAWYRLNNEDTNQTIDYFKIK